jgi:hypothetical protein
LRQQKPDVTAAAGVGASVRAGSGSARDREGASSDRSREANAAAADLASEAPPAALITSMGTTAALSGKRRAEVAGRNEPRLQASAVTCTATGEPANPRPTGRVGKTESSEHRVVKRPCSRPRCDHRRGFPLGHDPEHAAEHRLAAANADSRSTYRRVRDALKVICRTRTHRPSEHKRDRVERSFAPPTTTHRHGTERVCSYKRSPPLPRRRQASFMPDRISPQLWISPLAESTSKG